MNRNEFQTWLTFHGSRFTSLHDWLKRLGDRDGTLTGWFKVLEHVPLDMAKKASDALFAGQPPKWFDDHPRAVRDAASELRRDSAGGQGAKPKPRLVRNSETGVMEEHANCEICQDTGFVLCWTLSALACHRWTLQEPREGQPARPRFPADLTGGCVLGGQPHAHTRSIRCSCEYGGTIGWMEDRYSPQIHRRVDRENPQESLLHGDQVAVGDGLEFDNEGEF